MPDISLCMNSDCPSKESCYRFIAEPSDLQSYSNFTVEEGEEKCKYYWEDKD